MGAKGLTPAKCASSCTRSRKESAAAAAAALAAVALRAGTRAARKSRLPRRAGAKARLAETLKGFAPPGDKKVTERIRELSSELERLGDDADAELQEPKLTELLDLLLDCGVEDPGRVLGVEPFEVKRKLAAARFQLGREEEAEKMMRELLDLCLSSVGEAHFETANLRLNLGRMLGEMKRFGEAEENYRLAKATLEGLGCGEDIMVVCRELMAEVRQKEGRLAESFAELGHSEPTFAPLSGDSGAGGLVGRQIRAPLVDGGEAKRLGVLERYEPDTAEYIARFDDGGELRVDPASASGVDLRSLSFGRLPAEKMRELLPVRDASGHPAVATIFDRAFATSPEGFDCWRAPLDVIGTVDLDFKKQWEQGPTVLEVADASALWAKNLSGRLAVVPRVFSSSLTRAIREAADHQDADENTLVQIGAKDLPAEVVEELRTKGTALLGVEPDAFWPHLDVVSDAQRGLDSMGATALASVTLLVALVGADTEGEPGVEWPFFCSRLRPDEGTVALWQSASEAADGRFAGDVRGLFVERSPGSGGPRWAAIRPHILPMKATDQRRFFASG